MSPVREKGASFVVCFTAPRLWPGRGNRRQWKSLTGHSRKDSKFGGEKSNWCRQRSVLDGKEKETREEKKRGSRAEWSGQLRRKPLLFAKPPSSSHFFPFPHAVTPIQSVSIVGLDHEIFYRFCDYVCSSSSTSPAMGCRVELADASSFEGGHQYPGSTRLHELKH